MQILVKQTKLFFDGNIGEAPAGTTRIFNILDNSEFNGLYGHMNYRNFKMYANILCDKWNSQQPKNWRYEVISDDGSI